MIREPKEWLIERFYDGYSLQREREFTFGRAIQLWGYTKTAEELQTLSKRVDDEWLPVWFHVNRIPDREYEFGDSELHRNRTAILLPLVRDVAPLLCLQHKKISPVTLERAIELWKDARAVLKDATLRIRNIKTGECIAWECFE